MQCEREISNSQAQPRVVFQRMRGKAAKGAVPTEIRVLVVRLRRDIGPRGPREPLYRIVGLQTGLTQLALVYAAKWHPIGTTHDYPTHSSLPFPLSCPIEIDDDLAQAHFWCAATLGHLRPAVTARTIVRLKACSTGEAVTAEARPVEQTIYSPTEFRSPRFAVPSLSFQQMAGTQPFAMARAQPSAVSGGVAHRDRGTAVICTCSCHSYLIAAGVPGGSGRGSTSTMPCAMRTR